MPSRATRRDAPVGEVDDLPSGAGARPEAQLGTFVTGADNAGDPESSTNANPGVPDIFVDYSLVGQARRFRTRVKAAVRRGLHAGDLVIVHGDDVAPSPARVAAVTADDPDVELELLDVGEVPRVS